MPDRPSQMLFAALEDCLVSLSSCRHVVGGESPADAFARDVMDVFERQVS